MMFKQFPKVIPVGSMVELYGERHEVLTANNDVLFARNSCGGYDTFEMSYIMSAFSKNGFRIVSPQREKDKYHRPLTQEESEQLDLLGAYLLRLDQEPHPNSLKTRQKVIELISQHYKKLTPSTLYNYYKKWIDADRDITVFLPRHTKRSSQFSDEVLNILEEVIHDFYLTKERRSILECHEIFKQKVLPLGVKHKCMSRSHFYDKVGELDDYEVVCAREGREAARKKFNHTKEVISADYPLQFVEMDAVHLTLGIVDELTGEILGTLIVYFAICRYSRVVVGYQVGIKGEKRGENSNDVQTLIRYSQSQKPQLPHCDHQYFAHGAWTTVLCDAGTAFTSNFTASVIAATGGTRITTQTGTPKKKPFIERFNRTFREQLASKIPGYLPKRMSGIESDSDWQSQACVTLPQVRRIIEKWLCDSYHVSSHSGLDNQTPMEVWFEYYQSRRLDGPVPVDPANMLVVGTPFTPTIQSRNGIQRQNLFYNSNELQELWRRLAKEGGKNPKVHALYSEDISEIYITPSKHCLGFSVPCTDKSIRRGTTFIEHQARKKQKRRPLVKKILTGDESVFTEPKKAAKAKAIQEAKSKPQGKTLARTISTAETPESLDHQMGVGSFRYQKSVDVTDKNKKTERPDDDYEIDLDSLPTLGEF
jgi:putative transposase